MASSYTENWEGYRNTFGFYGLIWKREVLAVMTCLGETGMLVCDLLQGKLEAGEHQRELALGCLKVFDLLSSKCSACRAPGLGHGVLSPNSNIL
jgi:hypothetical protein